MLRKSRPWDSSLTGEDSFPLYDVAAPLPWFGIVRIAGALGDRAGVNIAKIDQPALFAGISRSAAAESRHAPIEARSNRVGKSPYRLASGGTRALTEVAYLISAGPRQPRDCGSRTRPLPQPPTRSRADTSGKVMVGSDGAMPAVTTAGNAGLV
jgi:hypothetical protein